MNPVFEWTGPENCCLKKCKCCSKIFSNNFFGAKKQRKKRYINFPMHILIKRNFYSSTIILSIFWVGQISDSWKDASSLSINEMCRKETFSMPENLEVFVNFSLRSLIKPTSNETAILLENIWAGEEDLC